jgi:CHASE2 domain-containing sensor protein
MEPMAHDPRTHSWLAGFVIEACLLFLLGWAVAFALFLFHDSELFKRIDRTVTDSLMRAAARNQLASMVDSTAPRFVFVDFDEEACRQWAKGTSCTLGMITPRDRIADIANAISAAAEDRGRPKLVVFDIEFAPQPGEGAPTGADKMLCSAILKLADKVDVIALRPMSVEPNSLGSHRIGYGSILDHEFVQKSQCEPAGALQKKRLWFASALIEPDPDGVARSVYAWDEILIEKTQQRGSIAGIGFLGATLLESHPQFEALRCYFDASSALGTSIASPRHTGAGCQGPIWIAKQPYAPTRAPKIDRIFFSLPYQDQTGNASDTNDYPVAPSQIERVEAHKLDQRLKETPALLTQAVVIVGGSYWSSGDLHPVPLNPRMPGAMVHANAIRAYAMAKIVQEDFNWWVKFVLITTASLTGALFQSWAAGKAFPIQLFIALVGVVSSVVIVLAVGIVWARRELILTGTAIGALTPALAVALEGGCSIFGKTKDRLHEGLVKIYSSLNNLNRRSK